MFSRLLEVPQCNFFTLFLILRYKIKKSVLYFCCWETVLVSLRLCARLILQTWMSVWFLKDDVIRDFQRRRIFAWNLQCECQWLIWLYSCKQFWVPLIIFDYWDGIGTKHFHEDGPTIYCKIKRLFISRVYRTTFHSVEKCW